MESTYHEEEPREVVRIISAHIKLRRHPPNRLSPLHLLALVPHSTAVRPSSAPIDPSFPAPAIRTISSIGQAKKSSNYPLLKPALVHLDLLDRTSECCLLLYHYHIISNRSFCAVIYHPSSLFYCCSAITFAFMSSLRLPLLFSFVVYLLHCIPSLHHDSSIIIIER